MSSSLPFESTSLWQRTLGLEGSSVERLRTAFLSLRSSAASLAAEIHRDLPDFTVHDISHIDALWGICSTIAGDDYPMSPIEGFCLGSAFLIHDLGMGLAAWPHREAQLRSHPRWADLMARIERRDCDNSMSTSEREDIVIRELLRTLHAEHAETLLDNPIVDDETGQHLYLLADSELRHRYGEVIGKIAHSHWWSIEDLSRLMPDLVAPQGGMPNDWTVRPVKLACLMRCADAAHIDDRRAPRLLRNVRQLSGESRSHWVFQYHLGQPVRQGDRLHYTSGRPFRRQEAYEWCLAYETLQLVDRELRDSDALLTDHGLPPLAARAVSGAGNPERMARLIRVDGWHPVRAVAHITDIPGLIRRLGGEELYGESTLVPLRELLQNAIDAVRARQTLENRDNTWGEVTVSFEEGPEECAIVIQDTGLGMSQAVLAGPLLDFGNSYWNSHLLIHEHPGLLASGFEPTGKFGIGFFSVFMWTSEVQVITRRPCDGATNTTALTRLGDFGGSGETVGGPEDRLKTPRENRTWTPPLFAA